MASIIRRTEDVAAACALYLDYINKKREASLNRAVDKLMAEVKPRWFRMVPRYDSREDAIAALKRDERDFFLFGSRYDQIMNWGWGTVEELEKLQAMCKRAGVIRLYTKDFEMLGGYLQ
jgi:hypothetical protein